MSQSEVYTLSSSGGTTLCRIESSDENASHQSTNTHRPDTLRRGHIGSEHQKRHPLQAVMKDITDILFEEEDDEVCPCCDFPRRTPHAPGSKPAEEPNQQQSSTNDYGVAGENKQVEEYVESIEKKRSAAGVGGVVLSFFLYTTALVVSSGLIFYDKFSWLDFLKVSDYNRDSWILTLILLSVLVVYSFIVGFKNTIREDGIHEPYRWLPLVFTSVAFPLIMAEPTRRWLIDLGFLDAQFFGQYIKGCVDGNWKCLSTSGILIAFIFTYVGYILLLFGLVFQYKIGMRYEEIRKREMIKRRVSSRQASLRNSRIRSPPCSFTDPMDYLVVKCDQTNGMVMSLTLRGLNGTLSSKIGCSSSCFLDLNFLQVCLEITGFVVGPLPSLGNLTHLQNLSIKDNQIGSEAPDLRNLTQLTVIDLSNNSFTGELPTYWCKQTAQIRNITVRDNRHEPDRSSSLAHPKFDQARVFAAQQESADLSSHRFRFFTRELHIPRIGYECDLPPECIQIGYRMPKLQKIYLSNNHLNGSITSLLNDLDLKKNDPSGDLSFLRGNSLSGSIPSFFNAKNFSHLQSIDLSDNKFNLIADGDLADLSPSCNIVNNDFSCFTLQHLNSSCISNHSKTCPLELLEQKGRLISPTDARNILEEYSPTNQAIEAIVAVTTALLRTTTTFRYSSGNLSLSLQTYNRNGSNASNIENDIGNINCSISIPLSAVSTQQRDDLSITTESVYRVRRVIGAQVFDEAGREIEIKDTTEKINITMGIVDSISPHQKAVCQWWNETGKMWSRDGCDAYIDDFYLVVCMCNHLTNFSVAAIDVATKGSDSKMMIVIIVCCGVGGLILITILSVIIFKFRARRKYRAMEDIGMNSTIEEDAVEYEEKIAESESSQVWRAKYSDTTMVAVKKMKRMKEQFSEECRLMKSLHHPNIVQYLGHNVTESYVVMEWMSEGNLAEYMRSLKLSVDTVLTIASGVSKGLSYIASMGRVHTAIIPTKILIIGRGTVTAKLCSFSCIVDEGSAVERGEKSMCMGPEVEREGRWIASEHIWNIGVLLWAMSTGRTDVYNRRERVSIHPEDVSDERVAEMIRESVKERREGRITLSELTKRMATEEKKKNWVTPQPHEIDGNVYVEQ
ncbi:Src protein [Planoprotostelium fungivorum]|uniref:non-specific serine/threonine protein kinase n=1 Tax=Planoprotostelium fungivorum TaxID=1890364 RepID=A0A2P6NYU0_9EUKA|nr:Src protein [Planoprotostelium fungivorum]